MDLTGRIASHKRDGQEPMWNRLKNASYLACQMRGQARFPFRTLSALRERLRKEFADRLGQKTRVNIAFVDALQRTAGGKFRVVTSHRPKPLPRSGAE